jgi:hypothetical protein
MRKKLHVNGSGSRNIILLFYHLMDYILYHHNINRHGHTLCLVTIDQLFSVHGSQPNVDQLLLI